MSSGASKKLLDTLQTSLRKIDGTFKSLSTALDDLEEFSDSLFFHEDNLSISPVIESLIAESLDRELDPSHYRLSHLVSQLVNHEHSLYDILEHLIALLKQHIDQETKIQSASPNTTANVTGSALFLNSKTNSSGFFAMSSSTTQASRRSLPTLSQSVQCEHQEKLVELLRSSNRVPDLNCCCRQQKFVSDTRDFLSFTVRLDRVLDPIRNATNARKVLGESDDGEPLPLEKVLNELKDLSTQYQDCMTSIEECLCDLELIKSRVELPPALSPQPSRKPSLAASEGEDAFFQFDSPIGSEKRGGSNKFGGGGVAWSMTSDQRCADSDIPSFVLASQPKNLSR